MNSDFRISVSLTTHPKAKKLMRRCGDVAFYNLVRFWSFVAQNKPNGVLSGMDADDIEIASGWTGQCSELFQALLDLRFIDDEAGSYHVHDWEQHNGFACHAEQRSQKAKKAAAARWERRENATGNAQVMPDDATSNAQAMPDDATSNAPSPIPSPIPNPSPIPKNKNLLSDPAGIGPDETKKKAPASGKKQKAPSFSPDSDPYRLAKHLLESIRSHNQRFRPAFKERDLQTWALELDRAIRLDGRLVEEVKRVIGWATADDFWQNNVQSAAAIRRNFDQLLAKSNGGRRSTGCRVTDNNLKACEDFINDDTIG